MLDALTPSLVIIEPLVVSNHVPGGSQILVADMRLVGSIGVTIGETKIFGPNMYCPKAVGDAK